MNNFSLKILLIPFVLTVLFIGLFFTLLQTQKTTPPSKPRVATTIGILGSIISHIAGDDFEVYSILKPGMDPHDYEPLPQDQINLNDSVLFFYIGLDFDDWALDLINLDQSKTINLSLFIPADPSDPHYWLSYTNTRTLARVIANELKLLKPEAEVGINSRLIDFQETIAFDREYALKNLELINNKNLITEHNAFGYFSKDLGLQFLGSLEQGHDTESAATHLSEITEMIKAYHITTIYAEPNSQSSFVDIIAKDYELQISYLDAEGIQFQDYLEMMRFNVANILTAKDERD